MQRRDLNFIVEIAKIAGALALKMRGEERLSISYKTEKDLVTEADKAVEQLLLSEISKKYPRDSIWGEETGEFTGRSDYQWVIDPIDGTTSYLHGQHFFSISIGLKYKDEIVAGVVYAPSLNELFCAEKCAGATLNDRKISVSKRTKLIESVLSTGFACVRSGEKINNLKYFCKILPKIREIRRFGSAALDLSYTACGRLEGFWEFNLKLYDICAGAIILSEAGGKITDFNGGNSFPEKGTAASNGLIHEQLLENFKTDDPR